MYTKDDAIILEFDVPGFSEEDLNIDFENMVLRISGERKIGRPLKISRAFTVSRDIDFEKIEAELKNGLLLITLPKVESLKTRSIQIRNS